MNQIPVHGSKGFYQIYVGENLLERSGELIRHAVPAAKWMIVTQKTVAEFHLKKVLESLKKNKLSAAVCEIPEGEAAKSQKVLFGIYRALLKNGFERKDGIIALGGGVTGDLAGFAAATYLRGIAFVNIPTTLLAQVDSAIGGKTAINLDEGKNLVGVFYPPKLVISDVAVLTTLPSPELKAALGEVIKYGVIHDARLFGLLEKGVRLILEKNLKMLEAIVLASSKIKAGVVSRDEFETKGERMILNFGHTFAHGFEQATGYKKLLHGEAVAIGMICAAKLAVKLKLMPESESDRLLYVTHDYGLKTSLKGLRVSAKQILQAMDRDKKKAAGRLRFVLPVQIGKVVIKDDVPEKLVHQILKEAGAN